MYEKKGKTKNQNSFSHPIHPYIQGTIIISIRVPIKEFLWFMVYISDQLPHGLGGSWITHHIFQKHYLMKKTSLLYNTHLLKHNLPT